MLLSDEQNTQSAWAAVAGDGTACGGLIDGFKGLTAGHGIHNGHVAIVGNNGLGDEQGIPEDILPVCQTVLHIGGQTFGVIAPVFLHNTHLAVFDLDAGLQVQQICAQSSCGGAAAALDQIIQLVDEEAGLHLGGERIQFSFQGVQIGGLLSQTAGLQNDQTLTGGQILGVDGTNIVEFFGSEAGILIRRGEAGAQIDMDNAVIFRCEGCEEVLIFTDAHGGGAAQVTAGGNMGKNIRGGDGLGVQIGNVILDNGQGDGADAELIQDLLGKVTGAVGKNLDSHSKTPFYIWACCRLGLGAVRICLLGTDMKKNRHPKLTTCNFSIAW